MRTNPHFRSAFSRRDFLSRAGVGFGSLALTGLLAQEAMASQNPMLPRKPHYPAKVKSVIFLFMEGSLGWEPSG